MVTDFILLATRIIVRAEQNILISLFCRTIFMNYGLFLTSYSLRYLVLRKLLMNGFKFLEIMISRRLFSSFIRWNFYLFFVLRLFCTKPSPPDKAVNVLFFLYWRCFARFFSEGLNLMLKRACLQRRKLYLR